MKRTVAAVVDRIDELERLVEQKHHDSIALQLRELLDATPCGKGWTGTKPPGCKRAVKATKEPPPAKAKAEPKAKKTKTSKKKVEADSPPQSNELSKFTGKKTSDGVSQDTIDEKYASANPTDKDIDGWMRESALREVDPSDSNVHKRTLEKMQAITYTHPDWYEEVPEYINKIKDKKSWAEAAYRKEQDDGEEAALDPADAFKETKSWKNYSAWSPAQEKKLTNAKKRTTSAKTEALKAKAKKEVEKLEKQKAEDRKQAEDRLKAENPNIKTKEQRIAELEKLYDARFKEIKRESQVDTKRILNGNKQATESIASKVVGKIVVENGGDLADIMEIAAGGKKGLYNFVRKRLQTIHKQGGGDSKLLGVDSKTGFSKSELKSAYRKAAAKAHPDRGGSSEKFRMVNEAYERLSKQARADAISSMHQQLDQIEQAFIGGAALHRRSTW